MFINFYQFIIPFVLKFVTLYHQLIIDCHHFFENFESKNLLIFEFFFNLVR